MIAFVGPVDDIPAIEVETSQLELPDFSKPETSGPDAKVNYVIGENLASLPTFEGSNKYQPEGLELGNVVAGDFANSSLSFTDSVSLGGENKLNATAGELQISNPLTGQAPGEPFQIACGGGSGGGEGDVITDADSRCAASFDGTVDMKHTAAQGIADYLNTLPKKSEEDSEEPGEVLEVELTNDSDETPGHFSIHKTPSGKKIPLGASVQLKDQDSSTNVQLEVGDDKDSPRENAQKGSYQLWETDAEELGLPHPTVIPTPVINGAYKDTTGKDIPDNVRVRDISTGSIVVPNENIGNGFPDSQNVQKVEVNVLEQADWGIKDKVTVDVGIFDEKRASVNVTLTDGTVEGWRRTYDDKTDGLVWERKGPEDEDGFSDPDYDGQKIPDSALQGVLDAGKIELEKINAEINPNR